MTETTYVVSNQDGVVAKGVTLLDAVDTIMTDDGAGWELRPYFKGGGGLVRDFYYSLEAAERAQQEWVADVDSLDYETDAEYAAALDKARAESEPELTGWQCWTRTGRSPGRYTRSKYSTAEEDRDKAWQEISQAILDDLPNWRRSWTVQTTADYEAEQAQLAADNAEEA